MSIIRFKNENDFPSTFSSMLDRFFDDAVMKSNVRFTPSVDISEDDKSYGIHVSLPGIKKEDIHLDIDQNSIVVSGERKFEKKEEGKTFHRVETQYGSFTRSFNLPDDVEPENIEAKFNDGVLDISLPKSEVKESTKKIEIK